MEKGGLGKGYQRGIKEGKCGPGKGDQRKNGVVKEGL